MRTVRILVYTREAVPNRYSSSIGNSIHFAYSENGSEFIPLNRNFGMVYPRAEIGPYNTIVEKGAVKPFIFRMPDGSFGILAVRVDDQSAPDAAAVGKVLFWRSDNLIEFTDDLLMDLGLPLPIAEVCAITSDAGTTTICWRDAAGGWHRNALSIKGQTVVAGAPEDGQAVAVASPEISIEGAILGNAVAVDDTLLDSVLRRWLPVRNTEIQVPDGIIVTNPKQVLETTVTAVYSDGSTHEKQVDWDLSGVDFEVSGSYTVSGIVRRQMYNFPLGKGYADPVILRWQDKWYFIATNDNTGDIGLYVREADTVSGLFADDTKEYCILDYDEERGFRETFWAPEFHVIGNDLYILFAVGAGGFTPQAHMMRLHNGGSITCESDWEAPVSVKKRDGSFLFDTGITLDMTRFEENGTNYLVWSQRMFKPKDTGSMLYIATVDAGKPWMLTSEPVLLSRPLYGWENGEGTINNEGPYPLIVGDMLYLAYSGGAAGGCSYTVGFLSLPLGKDPLVPANWKKSCAPELSFYSVPG